jgi:Uma2 family endonuclease
VAPTDVVFEPHSVTNPDLPFIPGGRMGVVTEANVQGAPGLVVEILSPGTRPRDLGVKRRIYARFGVPFHWVVDPEARSVRVFELRGGGYAEQPPLHAGDALGCPLFPGIEFPGIEADVADLFAP